MAVPAPVGIGADTADMVTTTLVVGCDRDLICALSFPVRENGQCGPGFGGVSGR